MLPGQQLEAFANHVNEISEDEELIGFIYPLFARLVDEANHGPRKKIDGRAESAAILKRQNTDRRSRAQEAYIKFAPALNILYDVWATSGDYKHRSATAVTPEHAIRIYGSKLNEMKDFACSDARTYDSAIIGNKEAVFAKSTRYENWARENFDAEASANAFGAKQKYSLADIRAGGNLILTARSACCTTFALAAAYILTGGQRNTETFRVECVAIRKFHCFVVVGREGGFVTERGQQLLEPSSEWGENAFIIDAWYGSMGREVIYPSDFRTYPSNDDIDALESKFDSRNPDGARRANPFAAISMGFKKLRGGMKCPKCGTKATDYSGSDIPSGGLCTSTECGYKGPRGEFF